MDTKAHWNQIYEKRASTQLGWYQAHLCSSLELFGRLNLPKSSPIIDVGGGDSTLVDDLTALGYEDVTVLDGSPAALARAKERLGPRAQPVQWIEADLLQAGLPSHHYALWHDRALFHFFTQETDRVAYRAKVIASLAPAGRVIVATFAPDGPTECSGLPTERYSPQDILRFFGTGFDLDAFLYEDHLTPFGAHQHFAYTMLKPML